jgi:CRP/FNR family transcriptional regulator
MQAQFVSARFDPTPGFAPRRPAATPLMAVSSLQKKAPGQTVFSEGDEAESIYEVIQGMVRLYKLLPDGRRLITEFRSSGELLGYAPEGACAYTAEAINEVTLCRYKRAAFERLIDETPGFAKRLLQAASHELSAAHSRMLLLGRKGASEKVASFLIGMADKQGHDERLEVPMTRADIADYLGLTIETVSRTLTKFRQEGLIALRACTSILILDRERLMELAAGNTDPEN